MTAPAPTVSTLAWRESKIQRRVVEFGAQRGVKVIPVAARGRNGFPDLLCFYRPLSVTHVCLIELKTYTGTVSAPQKVYHKELLPWITVFVAYGYPEAAGHIETFVHRNKP